MAHQIGFMQGRLSPKPLSRIQAFPKASWREEFSRAKEIGFDCLELIHDTLDWDHNPLASDAGRRELITLSKETCIKLHSICADTFMEKPLADHLSLGIEILHIAFEIGLVLVEIPFVDTSSLSKQANLSTTLATIQQLAEKAMGLGIQIALETDLPPLEFYDCLKLFPQNVGANLDLGNSAALGYDPLAECRAYGSRIWNVHIKDRVLGGTTVPVMTGHTDFARAFRGLAECHYSGDFILQTCPDPDYLGAAAKYRQMVANWIQRSNEI